jgi:hypothetical protein
MISLNLAIRLKKAGLQWDPKINDFFAIPDRGLDERAYVISEVMTNLTRIHGESAISFQGAPEWALDYLITRDVVWLPRESQIREALAILLGTEGAPLSDALPYSPLITLEVNKGSTTCIVKVKGKIERFESPTAAGAYGRAYLFAKNGLMIDDNPG